MAHAGIAVFILGVTHVNTYSIETDLKMAPGETYEMGRYTFTFNGVYDKREANYFANEGNFDVTRNDEFVVQLNPQKRFYSTSEPMTEASINTTLGRDLYVSLGEDLGDGNWSVRLYLKSFVACIWLGGFMIALGGLVATMYRRYRRRPRRKTAKAPAPNPTAQPAAS